MKRLILTFTLLCFSTFYSLAYQANENESNGDPFADTGIPYDPKEDKEPKTPIIHYYLEMIEIDSVDLVDLMSEEVTNSDFTAMRNKLFAKIKEGKARLIENQSIVLNSDTEGSVVSLQEYITHTEYDSPDFERIPKKGKHGKNGYETTIMPPIPVGIERHDFGFKMAVKVKILENTKFIQTELRASLSERIGKNNVATWQTKNTRMNMEHPLVSRLEIFTNSILHDGKFLLLNTHSSRLNGKTNPAKKILVFAKADILTETITQIEFDKIHPPRELDKKQQEKQQKQLSLYLEMIEINALTYAEIAANKKNNKDFTATRNELLKLVQDGKAKILESHSVVQRRPWNSIKAGMLFHYNTESGPAAGTPAQITSLKKSELYPNYDAVYSLPNLREIFEFRFLGLSINSSYRETVYAEAELDLKTEYSRHLEDRIIKEWKSFYAHTVEKQPTFFQLYSMTKLTIDSGKFCLLCTHTPVSKNGLKSDKKIIVMVKPTFLNIGK